jgi:O-antigen/teichoic acid export membrane protein
VLFPIVLTIVAFARPGLELWLGTEFAGHSYRVLQWLTVGVFVNSLAQIPFVLLQGRGRPDIPAKFHLIELPFYLAVVFALIGKWGVEGAAMAWVARAALDAILLFSAAWRLLGTDKAVIRQSSMMLAWCVALLGACALTLGPGVKIAMWAGILVVFCLMVWFSLFSLDERAMARHWVGQLFARMRLS